jgi:twitching motility protein PilT
VHRSFLSHEGRNGRRGAGCPLSTDAGGACDIAVASRALAQALPIRQWSLKQPGYSTDHNVGMQGVDYTAINQWLGTVWDHAGTDLLLSAGAPPLARLDGALRSLDGEKPLSADDTERIILSMFDQDHRRALHDHRQIDFSFEWEGMARIRANAFYQRDTLAIALRLIPHVIPTFEALGLPPVVDSIVDLPQGLVLVTGPTGSGKSTTLAAMIDAINQRRALHILTIEEPLEYVHEHKNSAVNQREVGTDCESFEAALRAALREDPDVILLGEMRDLESIQTALSLAETGHLVLTTLHTNDAAMTIDRIVDVFPATRQDQIRVQLAGAISAVISQRLLLRVGGGRVAAFEVLMATHAVRNLIRDGKSPQLRNVIATGSEFGMQTLEQSLSDLVAQGIVDHDEALRVSVHPKEVRPA